MPPTPAPDVTTPDRRESINHPSHYTPGPFEVFRVLIAWGFHTDSMLWDALIYIARCKKKGNELEDLKKARFWLSRKIEMLEGVDHTNIHPPKSQEKE